MTSPIAEPDTIHRPRLHRGISAGIVGILALIVSAVGYLREATLAAHFGVSSTMDAYFGAVFIPNTLYFIMISGTLAPVFIPILLKESAGGDRARLSETFSVITSFVLLLMVVVISLGMLTAPWWLPLLFSGFTAATAQVAVRLVYIIFPAVLFLALSGILAATLNGFHRFALAAFVPALSSMAVIASALWARGENAIYVVGMGTAAGFLLQAICLVPAAASLGIRYRPTLMALRHPAIKKLLQLGGPLFLYLVVANAAALLERNLASRISAGAVSTLTYAQRLFLVPSNFLAVPLAIVAYPQFAAEALRTERGDLSPQVTRIFRLVIFLFMPVTVWVMLNALPITRVLYEHGRFSLADSLLTARVLGIYCLGILPNAIAVVLLRCYFAIEDMVTPLLTELASLGFFVLTAAVFTARWGLSGLVASRTISFALVAVVLVIVLSRKRRLLVLDSGIMHCTFRAATASLVMGLSTYAARYFLQSTFDAGSTPLRMVIVAMVLAVGLATYMASASVLRMTEARQVMEIMRKLLHDNRLDQE